MILQKCINLTDERQEYPQIPHLFEIAFEWWPLLSTFLITFKLPNLLLNRNDAKKFFIFYNKGDKNEGKSCFVKTVIWRQVPRKWWKFIKQVGGPQICLCLSIFRRKKRRKRSAEDESKWKKKVDKSFFCGWESCWRIAFHLVNFSFILNSLIFKDVTGILFLYYPFTYLNYWLPKIYL